MKGEGRGGSTCRMRRLPPSTSKTSPVARMPSCCSAGVGAGAAAACVHRASLSDAFELALLPSSSSSSSSPREDASASVSASGGARGSSETEHLRPSPPVKPSEPEKVPASKPTGRRVPNVGALLAR